jgi:hypothetical protein
MMKTTLEVPDSTFRRAKSKAADQGIPLRQFVTEALEDKLRTRAAPQQKPWLKLVGKLKRLRKETKRINRIIEQHTEKIDLEMWR